LTKPGRKKYYPVRDNARREGSMGRLTKKKEERSDSRKWKESPGKNFVKTGRRPDFFGSKSRLWE
jgi:hypothetical protein